MNSSQWEGLHHWASDPHLCHNETFVEWLLNGRGPESL
jgi:hypothetical protein